MRLNRTVYFSMVHVVAVLSICLLAVSSASASVLASADFNGMHEGPVSGQVGGEGFRRDWHGSGRIFAVPGELVSDRYSLAQSDGQPMALQGDFNEARSAARDLCCEMSGEIWFSFLVNNPTEQSRAGVTFNWANASGVPTNAVFFLGGDLNVRINGRSHIISGSINTDQAALVVGMIDVGRGDDQLKVWIDPDVADEPDVHKHEPAFTIDGIDFAQKLERIGVISYDVSGQGAGGIVDHVRFATSRVAFQEELTLSGLPVDFLEITQRGQRQITIPTIDISDQTDRHVIIAQGTDDVYHGHATTLLMPDNKTMFAVWNYGHGGRVGPLKRSDDAGLTWSDMLDVPESWYAVRNCPAIYRLKDPQGKARLFVFAGQGPDNTMHQSYSEDGGKTWSPMTSNGLTAVMPFCTIEPVDDGRRLLAMTNIRRPGETQERRSNVVAQGYSDDGGLTWSPLEVVADIRGGVPCEPWLIRSPDGDRLAVILRENNRSWNSWIMVTDDGGRTWTEPRQLHASVTGDRHASRYTSDGRLFIAFRDVARQSPTLSHYVGWVGTFDDLVEGREGQYRVKLLHSHAGWDCGYAAVEVLPDDTLIATTYIKYRPGSKRHSVVSTRFTLDDLDAMVEDAATTPE